MLLEPCPKQNGDLVQKPQIISTCAKKKNIVSELAKLGSVEYYRYTAVYVFGTVWLSWYMNYE